MRKLKRNKRGAKKFLETSLLCWWFQLLLHSVGSVGLHSVGCTPSLCRCCLVCSSSVVYLWILSDTVTLFILSWLIFSECLHFSLPSFYLSLIPRLAAQESTSLSLHLTSLFNPHCFSLSVPLFLSLPTSSNPSPIPPLPLTLCCESRGHLTASQKKVWDHTQHCSFWSFIDAELFTETTD